MQLKEKLKFKKSFDLLYTKMTLAIFYFMYRVPVPYCVCVWGDTNLDRFASEQNMHVTTELLPPFNSILVLLLLAF
jgi:hypothetical protein